MLFRFFGKLRRFCSTTLTPRPRLADEMKTHMTQHVLYDGPRKDHIVELENVVCYSLYVYRLMRSPIFQVLVSIQRLT